MEILMEILVTCDLHRWAAAGPRVECGRRHRNHKNFLQQQSKFDRFIRIFNHKRTIAQLR